MKMISRRFLVLSMAVFGSCVLAQEEVKRGKYTFDAEQAEVNAEAADVFLISGQFTAREDGGTKFYEVAAEPLDDSIGQVGPNAKGEAKIQASIYGTKAARSAPRMGIGVHGQNGYRLVLTPARKSLELWKGEEVVLKQPFQWESGHWYIFQLSVKKTSESDWSIEGKVWKKGEVEPDQAQLSHKDQNLKGQGKCSLFATPYSGTPVRFDDISIELEEAK